MCWQWINLRVFSQLANGVCWPHRIGPYRYQESIKFLGVFEPLYNGFWPPLGFPFARSRSLFYMNNCACVCAMASATHSQIKLPFRVSFRLSICLAFNYLLSGTRQKCCTYTHPQIYIVDIFRHSCDSESFFSVSFYALSVCVFLPKFHFIFVFTLRSLFSEFNSESSEVSAIHFAY